MPNCGTCGKKVEPMDDPDMYKCPQCGIVWAEEVNEN